MTRGGRRRDVIGDDELLAERELGLPVGEDTQPDLGALKVCQQAYGLTDRLGRGTRLLKATQVFGVVPVAHIEPGVCTGMMIFPARATKNRKQR